MSQDDPTENEEYLSSLLIACDEALAAQAPLPALDPPPELRQRLQRGVDCLQLLRRCLPRRVSGNAALAGPASIAGLPMTQVGRFLLCRELGRGGFGIVFLADDPLLKRQVALKVPLPNALIESRLRERFLREARAVAGLDHPNLVPLYEAGEDGLICYIASAYCPGENLADWMKHLGGPVSLSLATALVAEMADAVEHAHSRGILHRDLKPANILMVPVMSGGWQPKITDFGLAKELEANGKETTTGVIQGTVPYMSPEQAQAAHAAVGPPTDVYALGVILYELLTGRVPFSGSNPLLTLEQVRSQEPVSPRRLRPETGRDLETICLTCLRKDPRQRYASARALALDLRSYLRNERIVARPVGLGARAASWCRSPQRIRDAGVIALFIGIISIINMALALVLIGLFPPDEAGFVFRHVLFTGVIVIIPAMGVGWQTLAGNFRALWVGLLPAPCYTAYMAWLGSFDLTTIGGIGRNRDQLPVFALAGLAFFLLGVQFVANILALFASYANRPAPSREKV